MSPVTRQPAGYPVCRAWLGQRKGAHSRAGTAAFSVFGGARGPLAMCSTWLRGGAGLLREKREAPTLQAGPTPQPPPRGACITSASPTMQAQPGGTSQGAGRAGVGGSPSFPEIGHPSSVSDLLPSARGVCCVKAPDLGPRAMVSEEIKGRGGPPPARWAFPRPPQQAAAGVLF